MVSALQIAGDSFSSSSKYVKITYENNARREMDAQFQLKAE